MKEGGRRVYVRGDVTTEAEGGGQGGALGRWAGATGHGMHVGPRG